MKYVKMLGLLTVAVAGLMAFAGPASATTLTSPAGTTYTSTLHIEGTVEWHLPFGITLHCGWTIGGKTEKHGAGVTAGGNISSMSFTGCGLNEVKVLKAGSFEVHATGGGNGTVTWSGGEITVKNPETGISCTYTTSGTDLGTLTGGSGATIDADSTIPRTGDSVLCGSSGRLTGSLTITLPSFLSVD